MLPVMNNRETIGQASTQQAAARLIRRTVNVPTGARLDVWQRPDNIAEILGLPVAWVWAITWGREMSHARAIPWADVNPRSYPAPRPCWWILEGVLAPDGVLSGRTTDFYTLPGEMSAPGGERVRGATGGASIRQRTKITPHVEVA